LCEWANFGGVLIVVNRLTHLIQFVINPAQNATQFPLELTLPSSVFSADVVPYVHDAQAKADNASDRAKQEWQGQLSALSDDPMWVGHTFSILTNCVGTLGASGIKASGLFSLGLVGELP
jgi:hypothetical protein